MSDISRDLLCVQWANRRLRHFRGWYRVIVNTSEVNRMHVLWRRVMREQLDYDYPYMVTPEEIANYLNGCFIVRGGLSRHFDEQALQVLYEPAEGSVIADLIRLVVGFFRSIYRFFNI